MSKRHTNIVQLPDPDFASCTQIVMLARQILSIAQERQLDYLEVIARDKHGNDINLHAFDQVYKSDWHS